MIYNPNRRDAYYKEVGKLTQLDQSSIADLVLSAQAGDINARNKVVESQLRYVVTIAKKYTYTGIPLEDLINEGNIGLIKAIEKYDSTYGASFTTYASNWILQGITHSINKDARTVRVPASANRKAKKEDINLSTSLSLDHTYDDEGTTLQEFIPADDTVTQKEYLDDLKYRTSLAMDALDGREREIIEMYYGFKGEQLNFKEIGEQLGLTKQRVQQLITKALRKLRANWMQ